MQTCGNPKLQEDDSFKLGDIDDDIDEQFYVWLWSLCLNEATMLAATTLLFNMFTCESVIIYVIEQLWHSLLHAIM